MVYKHLWRHSNFDQTGDKMYCWYTKAESAVGSYGLKDYPQRLLRKNFLFAKPFENHALREYKKKHKLCYHRTLVHIKKKPAWITKFCCSLISDDMTQSAVSLLLAQVLPGSCTEMQIPGTHWQMRNVVDVANHCDLTCWSGGSGTH